MLIPELLCCDWYQLRLLAGLFPKQWDPDRNMLGHSSCSWKFLQVMGISHLSRSSVCCVVWTGEWQRCSLGLRFQVMTLFLSITRVKVHMLLLAGSSGTSQFHLLLAVLWSACATEKHTHSSYSMWIGPVEKWPCWKVALSEFSPAQHHARHNTTIWLSNQIPPL